MTFSIAFLNCGPYRKARDWSALAATLHAAVGNVPHLVGVCEVKDDEDVPRLVAALCDETGKEYRWEMSRVTPAAPRLGLLIDTSLGHLRRVGDDERFRHGKQWRRWLAGRVELFLPGTRIPSPKQLVVVVNHWPSVMLGRRDTTADRELMAWEVGRWLCRKDPADPHAVPAYRQPCVVMGDFNCEPGSHELRSERKFTVQAMRTEPHRWNRLKLEQDALAQLYDLSWRRLAAGPAPDVPGTYDDPDDLHSPAMLDRMLVSHALWDGPDMRVTLDSDRQAMRVVPAVNGCSDHRAVAMTVELL